MKSAAAAWLIAAFAVGIPLSLRSQSALEHAPSLPSEMGSSGPRLGLGTNSQNSSGVSAEGTPNQENNTAEHDDSLYRGKTSDSGNPMIRDEGALHFKTHPKERIKEVDSLKSLQSGGTDPKFQGSFATSGVSSINKVAEKAKQPQEVQAGDKAPAPVVEQGDSRFASKHRVFTADKEDKPAKAEADSSPSPTPSPSASPAKKKSDDSRP